MKVIKFKLYKINRKAIFFTLEEPDYSKLAKIFSTIMIISVTLTCSLIVSDSVIDENYIYYDYYNNITFYIEYLVFSLFVFDYFVR